MVAEVCCKPCSDARFPDSLVVHLQGGCCRCAEAAKSPTCDISRDACEECHELNQSVVVRRPGPSALLYEYIFQPSDFISGKVPCDLQKATLEFIKHQDGGTSWYSACFALQFAETSGRRTATWHRPRLTDCCNIGWLRRHTAGRSCWPRFIEVQTVPTPDFTPPPPEWTRGHPDDLNDADYWPSMDVQLMQDSSEVNVRYFNGELQLRVKDLGSDGFGFPWGHTRIYSNRLSNSYDFGNGTNWLIHEWPRLIRRTTDPEEVVRFHPFSETGIRPTGCTLIVLRGTRNTLWFDEFKTADGTSTKWLSRFGAKQTLEFNALKRTFRVVTSHGHKWEFYAFSRPCFTPKFGAPTHDPRLDGRFIRYVAPGAQSVETTYESGRLQKTQRHEIETHITETFSYEYYSEGLQQNRIRYITWKRGRELQRAEYTYYGENEPFGDLGDLKTATTAVATSKGTGEPNWKTREDYVHYYRYQGGGSGTYCQGLLRCVIGPEAFHRIRVSGADPFTADDAVVDKYADVAISYYDDPDPFMSRRILEVALSGGARRHYFDYTQKRTTRPTIPPDSALYNTWHTATTEYRPDGSEVVVSSNFVGQTLRHDLVDNKERWTHAFDYSDNHGSLTNVYYPGAVNDSGPQPQYDPKTSHPPFHSKAGRVRHIAYFTPNQYPQRGFLGEVTEQAGLAGPAARLSTFEYREVFPRYNICVLSKEIRYGVGKVDRDHYMDGTTTFEYKFNYDDKTTSQDSNDGLFSVWRRITTLPQVKSTLPKELLPKSGENKVTQFYDFFGNIARFTDQRGTTTEIEIDVARGTPIQETITYRDRNLLSQTITYNYESDEFGRITEVLGPAHKATIKVGQPEEKIRSASWYVYKELSGERWGARGYAIGEQVERDSPRICIDPVVIQRVDLVNRVTDEIVAKREIATRPQPDETVSQDKWVRWTHQDYGNDVPAQQSVHQPTLATRVYHSIPRKGDGDVDVHYVKTVASADLSARIKRVETSKGNHYETNYNSRGLPTVLKAGCSEASLKAIAQAEYDGGTAGGEGNLTKLRRNDGSGNDRHTIYQYDWRNRQESVVEPDGTWVKYEYNNHNSISKMERGWGGKLTSLLPSLPPTTSGKSSAVETVLASKAHLIDVRGRIYERQLNGSRYAAPEQKFEPLRELFHYDEANYLIAYEPTGGASLFVNAPPPPAPSPRILTDARSPEAILPAEPRLSPTITVAYDGLGREVALRWLDSRLLTYEQTNIYRNEVGDPILVIKQRAFPDSLLKTTRTGDLGDENGRDGNGKPGLTPAHVSSVGSWFDPLGRLLATSEFGSKGYGKPRPDTISKSTFPTTTHEYNSIGELGAIFDPLDRSRRFAFDQAGRCTATGSNHVASTFDDLVKAPPGAPIFSSLPVDATFSQLNYTAENKVSKVVFHNTVTKKQESNITYGTTNGDPSVEPPGAHLPRVAIDAENRTVDVGYNELGEIKQKTDPNGTRHEYSYDSAGRIEVDRVTKVDDKKVDGRVRRIEYGYDEFGRLATIRTYDAEDGGTLLNIVKRNYGHYNELIVEAQLHSPSEFNSALNLANDKNVFHGEATRLGTSVLSTPESAPGLVGYYYLYPLRSMNVLCHSTTWYPGDSAKRKGGRRIVNVFSSLSLAMGRPQGIAENSLAIPGGDFNAFTSRYDYLGTDVVHEFAIQRGSTALIRRSLSPVGSNPLSSLDSLGREQRRKWQRVPVKLRDRREPVPGAAIGVVDEVEVSHDFTHKVRWRKNNWLNGKVTIGLDTVFNYNRLDRLTAEERGSLVESGNVAQIVGDKKLAQRWGRDQSGNWRTWRRATLSPKTDKTQTRDHNRTNDITQFRSRTRIDWPGPKYDTAGLMTEFPQPGDPSATAKARYDAWGNMTSFTDGGGKVTTFEYDGLGRRIVQRSGASERHYYYDQSGRVISEMLQSGIQKVLDREYIWDANSPLRLLCRIRYLPNTDAPERLYPLHDMQGNVTALLDEEGNVKERYLQDSQGNLTYLDADFAEKGTQKSTYAWEHYSAGLLLDRVTGLHFVGSHLYHVDLGRALPAGQVPPLSERVLNSYAQDVPFGNPRPPGIMGRQSTERVLKWIHEQPPWLKFTVGAAVMTVTVGVLILGSITPNPISWFCSVGAACGAIQAGVGAYLHDGDYGDIMLAAGIGAAFGAACPWGGVGSLTGSVAFLSGAVGLRAYGRDDWCTNTLAWDWGGLIGGLAGGLRHGALRAAQDGIRRPYLAALTNIGPDLLGGGVGAYMGHRLGGDLNSAFHGATMGMMAGNLTGATARGAWGVLRAEAGMARASYPKTGFGDRRNYSPPRDIIDFANANEANLNAYVASRMRTLGIPDESIGLKGLLYDQPFETHSARGGANLHPDWAGDAITNPVINVDIASLDPGFHPTSPSWRVARWEDRVDAIIAHEWTEVFSVRPDVAGRHIDALRYAPDSPLEITDLARQILLEDRLYELGF